MRLDDCHTLRDGAPVSGGSRNQPNAIAQMRMKKEKKAARDLRAAAALEQGGGGAAANAKLAGAPSVVPSFARGDAGGGGGPAFKPGLHKF